LDTHGIAKPQALSEVQKHSLACPAIPTCGLALSESERVLPGVIDQLEVELRNMGLADEKIGVRMTGCPNGCVRPYQSDIGIVGRSGDKYTVYVGGNLLGTRLNFVLRDLVPLDQIVALLLPLLRDFKLHRKRDEGFGDYCKRMRDEYLQNIAPEEIGKRTE
jgi:sulfite reductase (ferredoxin)